MNKKDVFERYLNYFNYMISTKAREEDLERVKEEQLGSSTSLWTIEGTDFELLTISGNEKYRRLGCKISFSVSRSNPIELAISRVQERLDSLNAGLTIESQESDFDDEVYYTLVDSTDDYAFGEGDTAHITRLVPKGDSFVNLKHKHYAWYNTQNGYQLSLDKATYDFIVDRLEDRSYIKTCKICGEKVLVGLGSMCPICYSSYGKCSYCNELVLKKDLVEIRGNYMCKKCKAKPNCRGCGTLMSNGKLLCDECSSHHRIYGYHSGIGRRNESNGERFRVGLEVEKEDAVAKKIIDNAILLEKTGWVAEMDSSLSEQEGFELISPIYPLDLDVIAEKISVSPLDYLLDTKATKKCGGHIHVSDRERSPYQILLDMKGYLPLLYSLYPTRAVNPYCEAKELDIYLESGHRQALNVGGKTLEFRIFPAVSSTKQLLFRLKLVKFIVEHPERDTVKIGEMLLDSTSELYRLLSETLNSANISQKANAFIDFSNYLDRDSLVLNNKSIKRTMKIPKLKIDKERQIERNVIERSAGYRGSQENLEGRPIVRDTRSLRYEFGWFTDLILE